MDEDRTLHSLDFGFLSCFFHEKLFPKFELLNSGCGLSASAAYLPVFTVLLILLPQRPILQVSVNGGNLNDVLNFTMELQTQR